MNIGNFQLKNNILLAPMAGITDMAFRLLCRDQGAGLCCTEMVSAKGLYYKSQNTKALLRMDEWEMPVGIQIFGSDPDIMAEIVGGLYDRYRPALIDINMGCPVPKIVNNGEGSALMKDIRLAEAIIRKVVQASEVPVTVKFRKGWDDNTVNAAEFAKMAEGAGAAAVTVHGRTRQQFYSGCADWEIIKKVKEAVRIPVIGNGDVTSGQKAREMLDVTGCDGVMVARGAIGNPWIFREIEAYLQKGEILPPPSKKEILDTIICHMNMLVENKGEKIGVNEMRTHISWYIKGMKNAAKIRYHIFQINNKDEIAAALKSYLWDPLI